MAPKKSYPLRVQPEILDALNEWAKDDLRSVNAQIEYILRDALFRAGRIRPKSIAPTPVDDPNDD